MKIKQKNCIIAAVLSFVLTISGIINLTVLSYASDVLLQGAWYESMYAEWSGEAGNTYNVYYKETASDSYIAIDSQLVREMSSGKYRADVLGLKGNVSYDVKVEDNNGNIITQFTDTPMAYDRSGFAFDGTTNAPGAYNTDGTVASNALIIYLSEDNKSAVYNNKSITSILGGLNSLNSGNPVILRVIGKVTPLSSSATSPGMWKNTCGVTIEGVGPGSGFSGWGVGSGDNSDTEIRNMNFIDYPEDAFGFENAEKLWVHNNTFYSGYNPKDSTAERDKLHGDGSCDLRECDNVTVSYNHFKGTDKTSLIGSSSTSRESTGNLTFHHTFFDETSQRTPRVRWHNIHVYNNYYKGTVSYGVGAACNSNIFAESNYFEDANCPLVTSGQNNGTFSDNDGGVIKAYDNTMVNCRNNTPGVDYFEASSRDYRLTASDFTTQKGSYTYNNFDASGYISSGNYSLNTPEEAKNIAINYSGAIEKTSITVSDPIAAPEVTGNITATYYYDSEESGSTGSSYGGINGSGTFFSGEGTCEAGTATGYRGTVSYSYSGRFSTTSEIKFTTSSAAKFTIIAASDASTPVRMTLSNSSNPDAVYHGTFQTGNKGNDVLSTINLLEAGTYSFKPTSAVDIYYMEVQEFDGETPVIETTTQGTTVSTESTETTTASATVSTTETTTERTTIAIPENVTPVKMGEAEKTFESDTDGDTGSGTSVVYNSDTDTWTLTDTSTTAAATLIQPFEKQSSGKVIVSGTVTPSTSSSKWAMAQIRNTSDDGIATEVLSIATDSNKVVSVRTLDEAGNQVFNSFGITLGANKSYEFNIILDLDNKIADVTVNGNTISSIPILSSEIDSFYSTTSKKSARNISVSNLFIGVENEEPTYITYKYGDADGNDVVDTNDVVALFENILTGAKIGIEDLTNDYINYVDVNADGVISSADGAHIIQKILNSSYLMPVER